MIALFDAVNAALAEPAAGRHRVIDRVRMLWPAAVGEELARHTEVLGMQGRLVVVGVVDRERRDFLFFQRRAITARLCQAGAKVSGVRLQDLPPRPLPVPSAAPPAPIANDPRTADVADPELRASLNALLHAAESAREA